MKRNKVYFFNRVIDFIIRTVFLVIPVTIIILSVCNFNFVKEKLSDIFSRSFTDLETGVIVLIIDIFITLTSNLVSKIGKKSVHSGTYIKHKIYSNLRPVFLRHKHKLARILGNKSINSFYHITYKPSPEQKALSDRVYEILGDKEKENKILWIQGNSFSGKTMTISHILINLISQKNKYEVFKMYDNKIIYLDLSFDDFGKFIKQYENFAYENSILFIDNCYVLSEYDLHKLINVVSCSVTPKITFICLREFNEISNDLYSIKDLEIKIKLVGEYYHLPPIRDNTLMRVRGGIQNHCHVCARMDQSTRFHYANMCEKNVENSSKILADIVCFLDGKIQENNLNHKIIFMLSCLCLFTGGFLKGQLLEFFPGIKDRVALDTILSELHSCGFIARSPYGFGEIYLFNSNVAKYYFKLGYAAKYYKNVVYDIIDQQYKYNRDRNNHIAFLYGCLLKCNPSEQSKLFDFIAINTNFRVMLNELDYVVSIERGTGLVYKREIGILCDRTGEFKKSRKAFKSLIDEALSQNNFDLALESFYRLVQIDHTEHQNYYKLKEYNPSDPFMKLQKQYWKLHIDMHRGVFSFPGFLNLLEDAKSICNCICYDYLHLARRIYFDSYRLYFLDGTNDAKKLLKIRQNGEEIEKYLKDNLQEFTLYYKKFTTLFLLRNEILYNLALDNSIVPSDIFELYIKDLGLIYEEMSDARTVLQKTIRLCEDLEDGFYKIGDKTFNFIRYYRTELLIIQNDPSVRSLIKQYREFGTDEIEYRLYAEFIELKQLISQLISVERISEDSEEDYDNLKSQIHIQLDVINRFFGCSYKNDYALTRYRIYQLLVSIIEEKTIPCELFTSTLQLAEKNKYNREVKLLNKLKNFKGKIPFGWCRNILLYYPIVTQ